MSEKKRGMVQLVGAGPREEMITQAGLVALSQADVVVYDDLADKNLLTNTKEECECIYVGKRLGKHSMPQEEINKLLIEKAKANERVVRLKGGDPFVFGRGGEEVLALMEEGILFEVIAGVTSSVAVPETLGIPVTHRQVAQSFTVITGHGASGLNLDFAALANMDGTLVFLMGLHQIEYICQKLLENGKDTNTPAAILSRGFWSDEKRIDGTLETLPQIAKDAKTPAIYVIGEVVQFDFSNTYKRVLDHVDIAITGTSSFTKKLSEMLKENGATVSRYPYLKIKANPLALPDEFDAYKWIVFTSPNGVNTFFESCKTNRVDLRMLSDKKIACIGAGCAAKLEQYGFYADYVPSVYTSVELAKGICDLVEDGEKVLVLRAQNGSNELTDVFDKNQVSYKDCKIYETSVDERFLPIDKLEADYLVFASAAGVHTFFEQRCELNAKHIICIGDITKRAVEKYTSLPVEIPTQYSTEGIVDLILKLETL